MKSYTIYILLCCYSFFSNGQEKFKPGKIDQSIVENTICPYDSSAGAFYILDYAETQFDHTLNISFKHTVMLKITDKSELDRGDITIPYYPDQGTVTKLKAFTYNIENGTLVTSELDKKNIFKEKVDEQETNLKFGMPNVRVGSVIEYSYTVNYGNYRSLNTWYFQTDIPVLKSEYHIKIPEYFDYYRNMTGYVPLAKATITNENGRFGTGLVINKHHHYIALNVPAFDDEKYIRSKNDVISKINFKLKSIVVPGSIYENYLFSSYGALANKMMEQEPWLKKIQGAPWAKDVLATLADPDEKKKAINIFNYIKAFEESDNYDNTLRNYFNNKKRGSSSSANRILIAVLREAGIKTEPVMIRSRYLGRLDPYNPLRAHFNFTIAKVTIDGQVYLLDASEKENVFGILPRYCLNGRGLVIKEGAEEWVNLAPYKRNVESVKSQLSLTEDGVLEGNISINRKGYLAWDFKENLEDEGEENYKDDFEKGREAWVISDHTIDVEDPLAAVESIDVELEGNVEDLGNLIYLNPVTYRSWEENPFKGTERIYPVDFGVPRTNIAITEINLPEGFVVETLPENTAVALPNKGGMLRYSVSQNGNKILINQTVSIKNLLFTPDDYGILREFFARVIEKNGEQIVLKRI